jgi:hypothetical protein
VTRRKKIDTTFPQALAKWVAVAGLVSDHLLGRVFGSFLRTLICWGAFPLEDQAVIRPGETSFRWRRRLGNEGFDILLVFIGQAHDALAHQTGLQLDEYTENIGSKRDHSIRDIARLRAIGGFATASRLQDGKIAS